MLYLSKHFLYNIYSFLFVALRWNLILPHHLEMAFNQRLMYKLFTPQNSLLNILVGLMIFLIIIGYISKYHGKIRRGVQEGMREAEQPMIGHHNGHPVKHRVGLKVVIDDVTKGMLIILTVPKVD